MTKIDVLNNILKNNNGFIKTSDAVENGVSRTYFLDYVNENNLIKVAQGIYMSEDAWDDDIYVIQTRYPSAIFSHETASYLLGLSEREPSKISLTFSTGTSSSRLSTEGIVVYKIKEELFEVGLIETETPSGNKVRVYNMERTLCDLIRSRNNIEIQELQNYIKTYVRHKDRDIPKLMRMSKLFSVETIIRKYLGVLL